MSAGTVRGKILTALDARDWSLRKAAMRAGIPDSTVRGWITGGKQFTTFEVVRDLAAALGLSLDWLADDSQPDDVIPPWGWRAAGPPPPPAETPTPIPTPTPRAKVLSDVPTVRGAVAKVRQVVRESAPTPEPTKTRKR